MLGSSLTARLANLKGELCSFAGREGWILFTNCFYDDAFLPSFSFGYVEFEDEEAAAKAAEEMNGKNVGGRELRVNIAEPRANDGGNRGGARGGRGGDRGGRGAARGGFASQRAEANSAPSKTVFVGNMSFHATQDALYEAFGAYGEVQNVRIPTDKETGRVKGFAYVEFGTVEEAKTAVENLQEADIGGRNVRLDFAQERQQNGDGGEFDLIRGSKELEYRPTRQISFLACQASEDVVAVAAAVAVLLVEVAVELAEAVVVASLGHLNLLLREPRLPSTTTTTKSMNPSNHQSIAFLLPIDYLGSCR